MPAEPHVQIWWEQVFKCASRTEVDGAGDEKAAVPDNLRDGIASLSGVVLQVLVIQGKDVPIVSHLLKHMERDNNLPGKGAVSMTAGILLSLLLFPQIAAVQAVLVLGLSDSLSTLVGIRYRKKFFGSKSKEGSVVFLASAFLILLVFQEPIVALAVALAATAAELVPFEDNITIPLAVGFALQVL
jgi:phytol kinase